MQPFGAAPHGDVLALVLQVGVLLLVARTLGEVAQRFKQPAVVGELAAGVLLGPSLLSAFFPALGHWLVPNNAVQGYLLEVVSLLGAIFLLLVTGLETDLPLIRHHARTALGVSAGGIVVTFSTGFVLGQVIPDMMLADPAARLVFALFVATAMSISAIPVIAKVLLDLNLMRRDIGQTIIAAGMSDDTVGWMLLSVVTGLATSETLGLLGIGQAIGRVIVFMALSFTLGRWFVKRLLDVVQDRAVSSFRLLSMVVVCAFLWGAVAQALHLEAILGAFVTGILFGQMPRLPKLVHEQLNGIALGVFAPVFFATAGLKVHLWRLTDTTVLAMTLIVIAVATGGKIAGTYLGARLIGRRDHWTALAFGAGLNARGAMEIIIATIGLRIGILGQEMFSIIVIMAITTSLMAPPLLRWVLQHVQPAEEEKLRLQQEALAAGSLIGRVRRVLVPIRLRDRQAGGLPTVGSYVLERIGTSSNVSITLLSVVDAKRRLAASTFLDSMRAQFSGGEVVTKVVESTDPLEAILAEAQKDYDVLVLGATEKRSDVEALFSHLVDQLVRLAPCTTIVVQGSRQQQDGRPRRILVPTNGTLTARRAAELGFALAAPGNEEVIVLNVVSTDAATYSQEARDRVLGRAYQIVDELCAVGDSMGARTRATVREGSDPHRVILDVAQQQKTELIIVSTDVRPGSDRLFLGPGVEHILHEACCPVIVVNRT
jgi:Kef-type K+ transport system membrane component KefB/nucleotide-binding universal stress UspA family protein